MTSRLLLGGLARGVVLAVLAILLSGAGVAFAASPRWYLESRAAPSYLPAGQEGRIIAIVSNLGHDAVNAAGEPVTITDRLPGELKVPANALQRPSGGLEGVLWAYGAGGARADLHCEVLVAARKEVTCSTTSQTVPVAPYHRLQVEIPVEVGSAATSGEVNTVGVTGGEAIGEAGQPQPEGPQPSTITRPITVSDEPTPFGIEGAAGYQLTPENEDGTLASQAGSHPFQLTTTLDLNQTLETPDDMPGAPALTRKLQFELPPGMLGDPQAVAECSDLDFSTITSSDANACPPETVIGVANVTLNLPLDGGRTVETVPVFNLVPARGEPARFGLEAAKVQVTLDTAVRTGGDYGVNVTVDNTTELGQLLGSQVTLWGEPYAHSHDNSRGWSCLRGDEENEETCQESNEFARAAGGAAFLTLPTSCTGPARTRLAGEAWPAQAGGSVLEGPFTEAELAPEGFQECHEVPFEPSLSIYPVDQHEHPQSSQEATEEREGHAPSSALTAASTPTGLNVAIELPAEAHALEDPAMMLGESAVKETTVVLPEGVQLNPSAANGLQACTETQVGFQGEGSPEDPLSPGAREPLRFSPTEAHCPQASKVGTVRIKSPDLHSELEGGVYIAEPAPNGEADKNPFGSLLAIYIIAEDPTAGLIVKLAGKVSLNEQTGQITTTFTNTPQVPFEELRLHFFEGPHASLSTPPRCGSYATSTSLTAWSGAVREPQAEPPFQITAGPGASPCPPSPLAFTPDFQAGSLDSQAGAFTPFTLTIGVPDGQQALTGLTIRLPAGIAALLSKVTPCPEPPAGQEWACGPESLIGQSTASSGLGSEPYELPGQVYLTSGYDGAPFGLLVQTRAKAGPFELGMVNVRSKINVDPATAAVTITTDPGPRRETLPTRLKGIPAQLKQINVTIDRPEFEFNPTNCDPMSITGTLTGSEGASEPVQSPFQVGGCQGLPFAPKLTAFAGGHGSKADGTSLDVKIESSGIGQANVAKVDLQLPVALSSRLPTLQKACLEAVFDTNPASCDEDSVIGNATVHTPVLSSPLSGPAYLVSHGAAEFPDVEFVLQGEGITLILDGKTDIKHGITYSKFESAPDAPFTRFETELPAGPHGILTPNVPETEDFSLCKASLQMPTTIVAQDGAVIEQTTNIAVTGCGGVLSSKTKLTQAQLLAKALKGCKKDKNKKQRAGCEKQARRKYATAATKKTAKRAVKSARSR